MSTSAWGVGIATLDATGATLDVRFRTIGLGEFSAAEVFRVTDPWEDAVRAWLETRSKLAGADDPEPVTTRAVLFTALGVPVERHDHRASMRVAGIFKRLGWRNRVERVGLSSTRVWHPADPNGDA